MTAWRRALHRWAGELPTKIIFHEDAPLFERSVVFHGRLPIIGEVTAYLHHYLVSDPDRGLHDHPWPWAVAIPLAGGYLEERLLGIGWTLLKTTRLRRPFLPYRLTGHDFHRVVLGHWTSWSLFITGANGSKPWGFLRDVAAATDIHGTVTYTPFLSETGSHTEWWKTAPFGWELKRAAP